VTFEGETGEPCDPGLLGWPPDGLFGLDEDLLGGGVLAIAGALPTS